MTQNCNVTITAESPKRNQYFTKKKHKCWKIVMENTVYKLILRGGEKETEKCSVTVRKVVESNVERTRNDRMIPE